MNKNFNRILITCWSWQTYPFHTLFISVFDLRGTNCAGNVKAIAKPAEWFIHCVLCQWKQDPFFTFYIACKNVFNWTFLPRINTKYYVQSKAKWHLPPELMHLKEDFLFCSQDKLPKLHTSSIMNSNICHSTAAQVDLV